MHITHEVQIGNKSITLETGKIAKQADGSCVSRLGDTVVLTTACRATGGPPRSFLPLTVDYREYTYAGGRIPGGFFKREGRPSEKEIITCRLTDRPLRPLFPKGYYDETQIVSSVLSADGDNDPDVLAINGASTALMLSKIPFFSPIGAVRVGLIEGEIVFNPDNSEREVSDLDLIVAGTEDAVAMVEAAANQLPEDLILECIFRAHNEIKKIVAIQRQMMAELGIEKPEWVAAADLSEDLYQQTRSEIGETLRTALHTKGKFERRDAVAEVTRPLFERLPEGDEDKKKELKSVISRLEEEMLREAVLESSIRFDGRALDWR